MRYVAYYRVSTARQGASGLGLEAQEAAVRGHCQGEPLAAFTEVESGKRNDRPQLAAALAVARTERATLVIAKLDRLARNVAFIANLMESGVEIQAVDMPHATRFTLHIMAAVAEQEVKAISDRTRAALAAARARGVCLGENRQRRAAAAAYAGSLRAVLEDLRKAGVHSVRHTAAALNAQGISTRTGGQWHATSVQRLLDRLAALQVAHVANKLRPYDPIEQSSVAQ